MNIRRAGRDDVPVVLGLLDGATEWLVARGRTDQWGTEPHSTSPRRIAQITSFAVVPLIRSAPAVPTIVH